MPLRILQNKDEDGHRLADLADDDICLRLHEYVPGSDIIWLQAYDKSGYETDICGVTYENVLKYMKELKALNESKPTPPWTHEEMTGTRPLSFAIDAAEAALNLIKE